MSEEKDLPVCELDATTCEYYGDGCECCNGMETLPIGGEKSNE